MASIVTAASSTAPVTMNFTEDSSARRSMPLEIEPMTSALSLQASCGLLREFYSLRAGLCKRA